MRVCIFAGGFSTTLSARIMPLAQMLKNFNVHCDIVTPFPWEFVAEGKLGSLLSATFTYHPEECIRKIADSPDLVIIGRSSNLQAYLLTKIFKQRNIKVIFDLDDAIFLPVGNLFGIKVRPGSFYLEKILQDADYVTVNGHYLLSYAKNFNHRATIIHDPIDTEMFSPEKKRNSDKVVIGWQGNARVHHENLAILVEPLKKVAKEYDNVKFKIASSIGDPFVKEMFSQLEDVIEVDYGSERWLSMREFAKLIYDFDIMVAPLRKTLWYEGKSALRVGIGMAMGIPVVASPVGEQKYIIKHGVNGFLANSEEEWYRYLKLLIEDDGLRRKLGKEGRRTAERVLSSEVNGRKLYEIISRL